MPRPRFLSRRIDLAGRELIAQGGHCFQVALPELAGIADTDADPLRSPMRVLEGGHDLGPPHASHADIRERGGGSFSHWQDKLYLSSSDDAAPGRNGRRYTVVVDSALAIRLRRWFVGRRIVLPARQMAAQGGPAYAVTLPTLEAEADDEARPTRSPLRLYEDGLELGPAHAPHDRVTGAGAGAFSHWQRTLLFSASDGTSPADNGRRYIAVMPPRVALLAEALKARFVARRIALPPGQIVREDGNGFAFPLLALVHLADGRVDAERSPLRLAEDGRALGPAHSAHSRIAQQGEGRYSHWHDKLLFSSSDNSSPRDNGRRYVAEIPSPLHRWAGHAWRRLAIAARTRARRATRGLAGLSLPRAGADDTLFFFYDLYRLPVTFDVAHHLVIAEFERRRLGLKAIHLVLVPGDWLGRHDDGFNDAVPPEATALRLHQLALPIAGLLPTCTGVTLCASRQEAEWMRYALARHVFPQGYAPATASDAPLDFTAGRNPKLPPEEVFPLLRANAEARRAASAFLAERIGERRAVVVTLRQYAFIPARNSRVAEWIAFADGLDPARYAVVFVPDTAGSLGALDPGIRRHVVCEAASWNVGLRMALYEAAHVNMAHMGGPLELALYNEACRYIVFIPVGTSEHLDPEILTNTGFRIGRDLPFARPGQRIVWEPDELPAIRRAFADFESTAGVPARAG